MMRAKKQVVKEFYPEGHSPLWKEVRVGNDCNHGCRVNWEKLQKDYPNNDRYEMSFEDKQKTMHTYCDTDSKLLHTKAETKPSYHPVPDGCAPCGHKFSKFYKIDWDTMDKKLHSSIVTGFRENFTKFKYHQGDTETEFRDDKTNNFSVTYNEPLDAAINRFLDENKGYTIVSIEYSSGGWYGSGEGENNQASALVLFEVEER